MVSTRLQAFYNPFIGFLPQLGLAAILLLRRPPGRSTGRLTLGEFTAFYAYLLMLLGADAHARHGARAWRSARPRRARGCSRSSTASRAITARPTRCAAAAGLAAASSCARERCATRARRRAALRDVTLDVDGRHDRRARRRDRLGQDDARPAPPAPLRRRPPARVLVDGADVRDVDPSSLRAPDRGRQRRPVPVQRDACARTSPTRARDATREEVDRGRGAARPGARLHRAAARRLRHARRRARPDAQRRPAPAHRDRPRAARRPADPDPRRRDLVRRRLDRAGDQAARCAR